MNEKPRLNRVQWVRNNSTQPAENTPFPEAGSPGEESTTPWARLPAENTPSSWQMPPTRNSPSAWLGHTTGKHPAPWLGPTMGNDAAFWPTPPTEEAFSEEAASTDENAGEEEEFFSEEEMSYDYDPLAEDLAEGEVYEEEAPLEVEGHPLLNALLILLALYVVCGLAPLFIALFVSLRVFFWLEIGGWVIILGWLLIGVRPPLMVWIKEKLRERKEQVEEADTTDSSADNSWYLKN